MGWRRKIDYGQRPIQHRTKWLLATFYYENHAWIFGTWVIVAVVKAGFLGAIVNQPFELDTLNRYLPVLMLGALAVTRNKWVHMVIAIRFVARRPLCHTQLSVGDERWLDFQ